MRCPQCKNKVVKAVEGGDMTLFVRKILISKSGQIRLMCGDCRAFFTPDGELLKILKNAVLLEVNKATPKPPSQVALASR